MPNTQRNKTAFAVIKSVSDVILMNLLLFYKFYETAEFFKDKFTRMKSEKNAHRTWALKKIPKRSRYFLRHCKPNFKDFIKKMQHNSYYQNVNPTHSYTNISCTFSKTNFVQENINVSSPFQR